VDTPLIVSIDDHVLEPPDIWQDRLPARFRDAGPRVVRERGMSAMRVTPVGAAHVYEQRDDGRWCDVWHYEDNVFPLMRGVAAAGSEAKDAGLYPITFEEVRPGCYDRDARLADMDANGTASSLNFPNEYVRFAGQRFLFGNDKELSYLCVRAYNDWVIDEWCAPSDGRLIPLCIVPLWDPVLAADEVRRTAARGARSVSFSELPANLGLPSIHTDHWDPLFTACCETDLVLSIHIGSGSKFPSTSDDAPMAVLCGFGYMNMIMSLSDWIMSGVLNRYPQLRILFAESQIGWLPYELELLDSAWRNKYAWAWGDRDGRDVLPDPPSEYFRRHCLCSFFDDPHGVNSIVAAGIVDNVALEVDYPHGDGTWPRSTDIARSITDVLGPAAAHKVIHGNAERFLRL
jgi:predicted TIM-barrel fold metal-dependent hydrolase